MSSTDGVKPDGKQYQIVICEDKQSDAASVRQILESMGYHVKAMFDNGQDLLDWCKANPGGADCIIMDIIMPKVDGYAAFWELKETGYRTRVVFFSIENTAGIIKNVISLGAYDFITKPFKREVLLERMKKVVHRPLA